jgi:methylthioribose-1-phosphate isomerase
MQVRGAPAIGATAAYGMALAAQQSGAGTFGELLAELEQTGRMLVATRPTAVNLPWAVNEMLDGLRQRTDTRLPQVRAALLDHAHTIAQQDEAACREMGRLGASLIPSGASILTHCNAGALATVSYGTALGVVRAAWERHGNINVFVDETRPFLQGARLTAWELMQEGIPMTLITDNMAGHFMQRQQITCVVVGADRIAANGDTANKIGTYSVAVLAKEHSIPFYVAAPISTIDGSIASGEQIPIEERDPSEVGAWRGVATAPTGVYARHPAFDVTPARYITAIITERGIARTPYLPAIRALLDQA